MTKLKEVGGFELGVVLEWRPLGRIFEAYQKILNRRVALKILDPAKAGDPECVVRFDEEARLAAKVRHANISSFIDLGTCTKTGVRYVTLELVEGVSTEELIAGRGGRVHEGEALRICLAVAEALTALEREGIAHHAVRLESIRLGQDQVPKLTDLGLARSLDASMAKEPAWGHPEYVAPERISGGGLVSVAADLYSLGICLFRLVTGAFPFDSVGGSQPTMNVIDPRAFDPDLSERISLTVAGLTAQRPRDRYPTVAEAAKDLERVLAGQDPIGPPSVGGKPTNPPTRVYGLILPTPQKERAAAPGPEMAKTVPHPPPTDPGLEMAETVPCLPPESPPNPEVAETTPWLPPAAASDDPEPETGGPPREETTPSGRMIVRGRRDFYGGGFLGGKKPGDAASDAHRRVEGAMSAPDTGRIQKGPRDFFGDGYLSGKKSSDSKVHKRAEDAMAAPPSGKVQKGPRNFYGNDGWLMGRGQKPENAPEGWEHESGDDVDAILEGREVRTEESESGRLKVIPSSGSYSSWEMARKERGRGDANWQEALLRRDHYFDYISKTLERFPDIQLTCQDGNRRESEEEGYVKAPRMILAEDGSRAYKVERELGRGGQGTVYKVSVQGDQEFDGFSQPIDVAAIKVSRNREALLQERAIYSQPNPGIIKLLDAGEIQGSRGKTPYLVLERLYPHPFQLFSRGGKVRVAVDPATALDTFINLLQSLHMLHFRKELPLVLCDIKPDNIMLRMSNEGGTPSLKEYLRRIATGAYEPVLMDMGCAQHHSVLRRVRGRIRDLLGTPLYLSPESVPLVEADRFEPGIYLSKMDVYALTLTFYEYLTGDRPYGSRGLYEAPPEELLTELLAFKRDRVDPVDYDLLQDKVGQYEFDNFAEILRMGLHPDPDYRASAKGLLQACKKKFKVKETRVMDITKYYYDDIKGLFLFQDVFNRIDPRDNAYLNPEKATSAEEKKRSRRVPRPTRAHGRQTEQHRRQTDRHPRPTQRHARPTKPYRRPPPPGSSQ